MLLSATVAALTLAEPTTPLRQHKEGEIPMSGASSVFARFLPSVVVTICWSGLLRGGYIAVDGCLQKNPKFAEGNPDQPL
jgi:hypothetical protein